MFCPYCDYENIEGADVCEGCGESLANLDLPMPASAVERSLLTEAVDTITGLPPLMVTRGTPLQHVLRLLDRYSLGCVVVVDDERVAGIFTERDALLRVGERSQEWANEPISRFMTERVETLEQHTKIAFAVHRMDLGGFRHLPIVTEAGRPIAVITVRDILRYLTRKLAEVA